MTADRTALAPKFAAAAALAALLLAGPALADGDTRAATAAEKQFHAQVRQTIGRAIPAAPKGWAVEGDGVGDLNLVPPGIESAPFRVAWGVVWEDKGRAQAEENAMLMAMVEKVKSLPPEKMAAEMERMTREMSPRDVRVRIGVTANEFWEDLPRKAVPLAPVAGAPAWRVEYGSDKDGGWREGVTWVFLGEGWGKRGGGGNGFELVVPKGAPSLAVRAVVVRIEADAARAKGILDRVDWAALRGLIRK